MKLLLNVPEGTKKMVIIAAYPDHDGRLIMGTSSFEEERIIEFETAARKCEQEVEND
uniref:hypothetical protein n=1 Tax=Eisenbergiella tayi TaxID=1432052 RepID=UPI003FF106FA